MRNWYTNMRFFAYISLSPWRNLPMCRPKRLSTESILLTKEAKMPERKNVPSGPRLMTWARSRLVRYGIRAG